MKALLQSHLLTTQRYILNTRFFIKLFSLFIKAFANRSKNFSFIESIKFVPIHLLSLWLLAYQSFLHFFLFWAAVFDTACIYQDKTIWFWFNKNHYCTGGTILYLFQPLTMRKTKFGKNGTNTLILHLHIFRLPLKSFYILRLIKKKQFYNKSEIVFIIGILTN